MTSDAHDAKAAELVGCKRCGGSGFYLPNCFRCDDSTDDHECPGRRPCDHSTVATLRDAVAEGLRASDVNGYSRGVAAALAVIDAALGGLPPQRHRTEYSHGAAHHLEHAADRIRALMPDRPYVEACLRAVNRG